MKKWEEEKRNFVQNSHKYKQKEKSKETLEREMGANLSSPSWTSLPTSNKLFNRRASSGLLWRRNPSRTSSQIEV